VIDCTDEEDLTVKNWRKNVSYRQLRNCRHVW